MRLTLQSRQVLYSRSSSHSISSLHPRSDFHQISESPSLQTKRICLLPEDLLNLFDQVRKADQLFPLANCFNQWEFFFSDLLNPFLLATVSTNENSAFLFINQFGCTSTLFWRCPLKSVRRKALGWISYFTPSSSSVSPSAYLNCRNLLISYFLYMSNLPPLSVLGVNLVTLSDKRVRFVKKG